MDVSNQRLVKQNRKKRNWCFTSLNTDLPDFTFGMNEFSQTQN